MISNEYDMEVNFEMTNFLFLAGEAPANSVPTGSLMSMLLPILLVFVVFYFFLIRPEKKRKKDITNMRDALKVGDEIVTIGGIVGKITNIKDEQVTIETGADKSKIRIMKWAIGSKEDKETVSDKSSKKADDKVGAKEEAPVFEEKAEN